jgi:pilus assembly protein CpaC
MIGATSPSIGTGRRPNHKAAAMAPTGGTVDTGDGLRAGRPGGSGRATALVRRLCVAGAIGLVALPLLLPVDTAGQAPVTVRRVTGTYAGQVVVPLNKSQLLESDAPFGRVAVGSSDIADVMPLSDRLIYVLGRSLGSTNLSIYGTGDGPLAVMDIVVTHDVQDLKAKLNELFPSERVEIRPANDAIVLSGTVSSAPRLSGVVAVAEQYAPGKVTNLLAVKGSQQVMLEVRFVEVRRTLARELGIKPTVLASAGEFLFSLVTLDPVSSTAFAAANLSLDSEEVSVDTLLDALEAKGVITVLAEPNLVAMSGDTARFLAGGEFPVPVAQEGGDSPVITVEFKEFGVSLAFTPTVVGEDLINLVVNPEVSAIDPTASITVSGFVIPGLSTRRATTTVELRDGQSFAVAGLLQSDFSDSVRQLPWLGDIPVLGALLRSSSFQRNETELVILVTAYLVKPAYAAQLASPLDSFMPPTDYGLFFLGRVVGEPEAGPADENGAAARRLIEATSQGGLAARYGHVIQ